MKNQTEGFVKESYRYVSSYLNDELKNDFLSNEEIFKSFTPQSILDVGCGNGNPLKSLVGRFDCKGVGVEPSEEAIKLLKEKHSSSAKSMTFCASSAHSLPFESDSFDLVYTWSVLHWVGRNEYLQSLGELLRVTKKYLIVMDFVASENYSTVYHHNKDFYTYKMDFEPALLATGVLKKIYEKRWWINPSSNKLEFINESDLIPFEGNIKNYHARKMVVFEKNFNLLSVRSEEFFYEHR